MIHRILITALYGETSREDITYYYTKDFGLKTLYCDAVMAAEAGCKYVLSAYPIEEIIVFTDSSVYRPENEKAVSLQLPDMQVSTNLREAPEFSILQYRLMQFFEDISMEDADQNDLLSAEEQAEARDFLRRFIHKQAESGTERKLSRYFNYLNQDQELYDEFEKALRGWISNPEKNLDRFRAWILRYLYRELKATAKLEPLEQNEDVRMRCFYIDENDHIGFLRRLMTLFRDMEVDDGVKDDIELYICLQADQMSDIFSQMNAMNLTRILPNEHVRICRVITETSMGSGAARLLYDQTEEYNISELMAGTGAFLSYGKTDLLVEYWKKANRNNPTIDRIIYAMRNIDAGISLCDIADIERGIRSLRAVIKNDLPVGGETVIERYFEFVVESIRRDYGALLEEDQISFFDLVLWAYRKGFLQQTLTLIESRAPGDFVEKGIYFYSDGERTRKHTIEVLGQVYYDLKPFEKYKLEDVSHYYVKYYGRNRAARSGDGDSYQMNYANLRIEELDLRDSEIIQAHTVCPDRSALKDLLFAYYHLGDVRNMTNHATEEYSGFYTIMSDTDPGERMKLITQAIDFFIHCYKRVAGLIKDKDARVVTVRTSELADYAKVLREKNRRDRGRPDGK